MSELKSFLLGPPQFEYAGKPVTIGRRKAVAMVAYLAVMAVPQSREFLAALLWPESDTRRASASLRNVLWSLRQALGEGWLEATAENIGLNVDANVWTDVAEFQRLLASGASHDHEADQVCLDCQAFLVDAVALYRDDFLLGFTLPDCPGFDEWQFFQREDLRQALADTLKRLVGWHVGLHEYEMALPYGRRWVSLDPLHEPAQRELMRLYALNGQQSAALRQYEELRSLLGEELDIAPEQSTTSLHEAIRTRRFPETEAAGSLQAGGLPLTAPVPSPPFMEDDEEATEREDSVFVGRRRELQRLHSVLHDAVRGPGQFIFIVGGAGRGKTTLVQEFLRQAQAETNDLLVVTGNGNAHTGIGDPYLPFREALTMLTGDVEGRWSGGLISSSHARRLWQAMAVTVPALVEHAPDLVDSFVPGKPLQARAALMEPSDAPWFAELTSLLSDAHRENLQQKDIFAQYTAVLKSVAGQRPILLILEDLHWIDAASVGLLFHLSRELRQASVLILGTYRPEEVALSWADIRHPLANIVAELKRQEGNIWLDLGDEPSEEGRRFVDAYLDRQPNQFDESFREALFRRTGGHALFTVELLRNMRERGDIRLDAGGRWLASDKINWQILPAKVEGVIESRIGRLNDELRSVLTVASVEGETFTAEVVAQVQQVAERRLVQQLSHELGKQLRLVAAQGLEQLKGQRLSFYRFRHYLFQHYLYHNLSESERAYLHEEIGTVLEALYRDRTEQIAIQLARHFQEAGVTEKAANYLLKAGGRSLHLSAFEEAIEQLSLGLHLLQRSPDTPERLQKEIMSQIALSHALVSTQGYVAPAVKESYDRALELCQKLGETPQLFPVLYGIWSFYYLSGEHATAFDLAKKFLRQAEKQEDRGPIMVARRVLGTSMWIFGEQSQSRTLLEQSIALYDREQYRSLARSYGKNLAVAGPMYLSVVLSALGYQDQARRRIKQALSVSQETAHPFTSAAVFSFAAMVYLGTGEWQKAERYAERGINLCLEHNLPYFQMFCTVLRSAALSERAPQTETIAQMQKALSAIRAMGAEGGVPYFLGLQARMHLNAEQPAEGLEVLAEALALVEQSGECNYEAELHRIKGELLRAEGRTGHDDAGHDSPETCFLRAIEVAQRQRAKWYELRATMSLCKLRQQQGRTTQAWSMLDEVYAWFTEGFDTRDLIEAKALLNDLSRQSV